MQERERRYEQLCRRIASLGPVAVAFSGGVDSALLLRAAVDALGRNHVIAVTVRSEAVPERETEAAASFCSERNIRLNIAEFRMLDIPGVRDNPPERCYLCKRVMFTRILQIASEQGFMTVVEGSNLDDDSDYRPGRKALEELGIRSPLREAGLDKAQIRVISKQLGLPAWNKPALACLATRIACGEKITEEKLRSVERAEQYLQDLGFGQIRVRLHSGLARIEVEPAELDRLLKIRTDIAAYCRSLGFSHVCLDLEGYRTGSMNPKEGGSHGI